MISIADIVEKNAWHKMLLLGRKDYSDACIEIKKMIDEGRKERKSIESVLNSEMGLMPIFC